MKGEIPEHLHANQWSNIPNCKFYGKFAEILQDSDVRNIAHYARRSHEQIGWDGMLAIGGKPTAYFKQVAKADITKEATLHRQLWNQSIANVLIVSDAANVRIYSSLSLPRETSIEEHGDERLVESLSLIDFVLQTRSFALELESGQYYERHRRSFTATKSLDSVLLRNLKATRDRLVSLENRLKPEQAHTLLGRMLFICYLRDRGIISGDFFAKSDAPGNIDSLYKLFTLCEPGEACKIFQRLSHNLHDDFNGSLFSHANHAGALNLRDEHIPILGSFLSGDDVNSGQLALGFPAYDFSLIPIETISAIYEDFLSAEGQDQKRGSGAYYTPIHLAELTVDIATAGWSTLIDKRILDPACGSGIFLVTLFNRMAEEWRWRNPKSSLRVRAQKLTDFLKHNLFGVDINETACRITAFSLYIALLDQFQPRDIEELKSRLAIKGEKLLPRLVAEISTQGSLPLTVANFFDSRLDTPKNLNGFDLIIGNPPWVGRNQTADPVMSSWLFDDDRNPYLTNSSTKAAIRKAIFLPQNQSAHAFMWKAPLHAKANQGRVCMIVPSKSWLNESTNKFQSLWAKSFTIEQLWELADHCFVLFDNADSPSSIVRYSPNKPNDDDCIEYFAPKVSRVDPKGAIVVVDSIDVKMLSVKQLQNAADADEAPIFWKKRLWGSEGDSRLLDRLRRMPTLGQLAGEPTENWPKDGPRWIKGQGFKPHYSNQDRRIKGLALASDEAKSYPRWWTDDSLFVSAKNKAVDLFLLPDTEVTPIGSIPARLHRSPDKRLFQPPLVVINQGFDRAAYSDFDVLFQHSLQSIKGPPKDSDLLMFLTGVLNTALPRYFMFHTSSNWGVERDKVHFAELLRLPFALPEQTRNPVHSWKIVRGVVARIRQAMKADFLSRANEIEQTKHEIEKLVFDYYNISSQEKMLIDDTIKVAIPSSTPSSISWDKSISSLRLSTKDERAEYAKLLCVSLNKWIAIDKRVFCVKTYLSAKAGFAVVVLRMSSQFSIEEIEAPNQVEQLIGTISVQIEDRTPTIVIQRGLIHFEGESVYLFKPLKLRHWLNSTALADANTIFSSLAMNQ